MKKHIGKRIVAFALLGAMTFSLTACGKDKQGGTPDVSQADLDKITELNVIITSHASWPYNENWPIWKWIQEGSGVKLNIQAIPGTDFGTKLPLILASPETLPDLIHMVNVQLVNQNTSSGAFVSITDNLDKMPNYTAFMNTLPETERKELEAQRTSGDGKMYFPPVYGTQTVMNLRTWMYRKDIFQKHNLETPKTEDELYAVTKELKKLYPSSYPLAFRTGLEQINVMGPMWKNNFAWALYYDFKEEKWCWGAQDSETMPHIIEFFSKMIDEGLVPPDFLSITTKSWEELVSTDRGFIMPEYLARVDFFNKIGRTSNPDYTWSVMEPPKGSTATGQAKIAKLNLDPTGYVVCNTGKTDRINKSLWFVDWMYTDEATDLLSWGKEGESYTVDANGTRSFILDASKEEAATTKYGIGTYGVYQRTTSFEETYSSEQREEGKRAYTYTEDNVNPTLWLPLNDEEMKVYDELYTALVTYTEEMLSKFILKQEPMSKWDAFQKGMTDMGVDRLLEAYTSAYNRVTGKN